MERLRELRKELKKTQQQMAKFLGITQQAYAAYENNKAQPPIDIVNKLASYFNVQTDYLLGRTDSPAPPYPSGGIEDVRTELKRLGIDGNDEELHYLLKKIGSLTPEQKQLIITMINNFKD